MEGWSDSDSDSDSEELDVFHEEQVQPAPAVQSFFKVEIVEKGKRSRPSTASSTRPDSIGITKSKTTFLLHRERPQTAPLHPRNRNHDHTARPTNNNSQTHRQQGGKRIYQTIEPRYFHVDRSKGSGLRKCASQNSLNRVTIDFVGGNLFIETPEPKTMNASNTTRCRPQSAIPDSTSKREKAIGGFNRRPQSAGPNSNKAKWIEDETEERKGILAQGESNKGKARGKKKKKALKKKKVLKAGRQEKEKEDAIINKERLIASMGTTFETLRSQQVALELEKAPESIALVQPEEDTRGSQLGSHEGQKELLLKSREWRDTSSATRRNVKLNTWTPHCHVDDQDLRCIIEQSRKASLQPILKGTATVLREQYQTQLHRKSNAVLFSSSKFSGQQPRRSVSKNATKSVQVKNDKPVPSKKKQLFEDLSERATTQRNGVFTVSVPVAATNLRHSRSKPRLPSSNQMEDLFVASTPKQVLPKHLSAFPQAVSH